MQIRKLRGNVRNWMMTGEKNIFRQNGRPWVNIRAPGSWHGKNDISIFKGR